MGGQALKDFIGRDALARIAANGVKRKMVGLEIEGPRTIRNGYRIYRNGKETGRVTSGPLSSSLTGRNCGLGYVATADAGIGTELEIDIRGKRSRGRVVATPFSPRGVKDEPRSALGRPISCASSNPCVGGSRDGSKGCRRHRHHGFRPAEPRRHPVRELPKVGDQVAGGSALGWVDSYRRAFDVVSPVSGEVIEVNPDVARIPRTSTLIRIRVRGCSRCASSRCATTRKCCISKPTPT